MQNELYIGDELADLSDEKPIAITFQVNNLADLQDRQSTFSQAIKLPKTATNKRLFGYADSDSFTTDVPYKNNTAKLVQGGVETIPYGQIIPLQVADFFEAQLVYGLAGINDLLSITVTDPLSFIKSIRDANLTDLDYTDIPNFNFDLATVVASQAGTGTLWPVIDYGGTLDSSSIIDITYLRPGIYYHVLMEKIAGFIGYTFQGDIFSDNQYRNDFIPFSNTILYDYEGGKWDDTHIQIGIAKNMPNIALKDFLKDFMQRYFLTPVVDNYAKTLTFRSFDELYANRSIAKDWTDKFVDDARTDAFTLPDYAQVNYFTWTPDEANLSNGNGILNVKNTNIKTLFTTLITSIFSASNVAINVLGGQNVASIKKFAHSPLPTQGEPFSIDTQLRIINIRNAKQGVYGFKDTHTTSFTTNCKIGLFWDNTGKGIGYDNQLAQYGTGLTKLLEKCRVITRYVDLKPVDLANIDFFIPIYDAKEAKYYYINQISNFIPGQKTKVQFIRM